MFKGEIKKSVRAHKTDMNTGQRASSRQILMSNPPGAGGFAAHTVPLANPNRVVGGAGYNSETNPVIPHRGDGSVVKMPEYDGTYRPAHYEVVQSWRRDPISFPEPYTLRLAFSKPMKNVFAIELLEMNAPNVAGGSPDPAYREFLLLNGLMRNVDGEYKFSPQGNIPKDRSFHTMVAHNANDPSVDRSDPAWDDVDYLQLDDYALARFPYDASKSMQHWKHGGGFHQVTFFPTPLMTLEYLDLTLADPRGDPYMMDTAEGWSATLEILSTA